MELIHVALSSIGSVFALFVFTKIMGNRQMSQLSMFDYINGITIGSIAAEMATSLENDFLKPLIAMLIYTIISLLFSWSSTKSIKVRRILTGKSLILMNEGKIYQKNLKKAHLDINEFLVECRSAGYFNIADLQTAILETNGKISFLPISNKRPLNPFDVNIKTVDDKMVINIIIDGEIMEENLKYSGNNLKWLKNQLNSLNITKVEDVFLATCDAQNNLVAYKFSKDNTSKDPFQ